jgi:biopolymer transport protein ExbD
LTTATFISSNTIKLNLPTANSDIKLKEEKNFIISISKEEKIFIDKKETKISELKDILNKVSVGDVTNATFVGSTTISANCS